MVSPSFSLPLAFSLRRRALSTAYSSNGLSFHSRPSVLTVLPSAATFTLFALSGSLTRLTGTRIFTRCLRSNPQGYPVTLLRSLAVPPRGREMYRRTRGFRIDADASQDSLAAVIGRLARALHALARPSFNEL